MSSIDVCVVNAGDPRIVGTVFRNHASPVDVGQSCMSLHRSGEIHT